MDNTAKTIQENRTKLTVYMGGAGSGKSLVLQNIAVDYVLKGTNVIYVTVELSEVFISSRIDNILEGRTTSGTLTVGKLPINSSVNDILTYVNSLSITSDTVLVIDYVDLLIDSEELSGINIPNISTIVTAAQTNRNSTVPSIHLKLLQSSSKTVMLKNNDSAINFEVVKGSSKSVGNKFTLAYDKTTLRLENLLD